MKKLILTTVAFLMTSPVLADGFTCDVRGESVDIQIYNHVNPNTGTRTANTMIISDENVARGNKTIAVFSHKNKTLANHGANYTAKVDLRYSDSGRKGENIAGTKLGQIDTIYANLKFSYSNPVNHGDRVEGSLLIVKRNGKEMKYSMYCKRYLKN